VTAVGPVMPVITAPGTEKSKGWVGRPAVKAQPLDVLVGPIEDRANAAKPIIVSDGERATILTVELLKRDVIKSDSADVVVLRLRRDSDDRLIKITVSAASHLRFALEQKVNDLPVGRDPMDWQSWTVGDEIEMKSMESNNQWVRGVVTVVDAVDYESVRVEPITGGGWQGTVGAAWARPAAIRAPGYEYRWPEKP
jgi:hypothetical protein